MKRKILIISPSLEDGSVRGLGKVTQTLINGISDNGFEALLLTGAPITIKNSKRDLGRALLSKRGIDHYLHSGIHSPAFQLGKLSLFKTSVKDFIRIGLGYKNYIESDDIFFKHKPESLKNYSKINGIINICFVYRLNEILPNRMISWLIFRAAKRNGVDTIITSSPFAIKKPVLLSGGVKLVQYVHDIMPLNILETVPGSGKKFLRNLNIAYKSADEVITSSETTRIKVNKIFSKDKAKLLYLPFVTPSKVGAKINTRAVLQNYQLKQGGYLVCLSVMELRKNINRLIQAFSLSAIKPELKLVLVGDRGEGYTEIIDTYNSLGKKMRDRIVITGFVSEEQKQVLLENSNALIHPSIDEGLGIPVIEALINRKPAIATRLESIEEFAPEGSVIYIDDPYDIYEIANKIETAVKIKTSKVRLDKTATSTSSLFSADTFNRQLRKILS